ncbi:MAG: ABC transporter C-terminal domain-containing protein, partial [Christensenellales bacterium]
AREKRRKRLLAEGERRVQEQLRALEQAIADAEARTAHLTARMGEPEVYRDGERAARVAREHREIEQDLEALYLEWAELTQAAEAGYESV